MPFTIPNLHARTKNEVVCPAAGQAAPHSQLPLLGQPAGRWRVA